MTAIVFIDTETTHLDPRLGDMWEIGLIHRNNPTDPSTDVEYAWQVRPNLEFADDNALRVGGYYQRCVVADLPVGEAIQTAGPNVPDLPVGHAGVPTTADAVAADVAQLIAGTVAVGCNPPFDERHGAKFLTTHGQCWTAHYRTVDVGAVAYGHCVATGDPPDMPWRSGDLGAHFGFDGDRDDKHTALGDARFSRDLWDVVHNKQRRPGAGRPDLGRVSEPRRSLK